MVTYVAQTLDLGLHNVCSGTYEDLGVHSIACVFELTDL